MRRSVAFVLLGLLAPSEVGETAPVDVQRERVIEFERHYDRYFRELFGCPTNPPGVPTTREVCVLPSREDAKEFDAAREAAKKLFDLR